MMVPCSVGWAAVGAGGGQDPGGMMATVGGETKKGLIFSNVLVE